MLFIPIASVDPLWSNADIVGGIIPVMPSTIKDGSNGWQVEITNIAINFKQKH